MYYMITANDLDDDYTRAIAHARFLTYVVGMPAFAKAYVTNNGWAAEQMRRLVEHRQFESMRRLTADQTFHRADLIEASKLVPERWIQDTCAIGSLPHCLDKIREYRDAGADEIGFYGSTPAENTKLIDAWRTANSVATS
jgi:5,10-methylenetetrahydromethanopterin reductase